MTWTEEDRRRASEQQSRMQRACDESLRLHQQRQSAIQARKEAVRREDHEKYIRVQQSRFSQTFTNRLQSSTRPSVESLSSVQAPAQSRSKRQTRANEMFWHLCGLGLFTYMLYRWQLPRVGIVGTPGLLFSAIVLLAVYSALYALRRLILLTLKWTFIVAILGGLIYLFLHPS
jgi:hypothetical protein